MVLTIFDAFTAMVVSGTAVSLHGSDLNVLLALLYYCVIGPWKIAVNSGHN